jgi:hypothetical protein
MISLLEQEDLLPPVLEQHRPFSLIDKPDVRFAADKWLKASRHRRKYIGMEILVKPDLVRLMPDNQRLLKSPNIDHDHIFDLQIGRS